MSISQQTAEVTDLSRVVIAMAFPFAKDLGGRGTNFVCLFSF
jgi:hypothetical protein